MPKYWGRHHWARGYYVSTLGIDEEMIRQHVQRQEKREREEERQPRLF